jgi:hypothetical protein
LRKRSLYSRVSRRLRHIADADEVRGLKRRREPIDDGAASVPLLRHLQSIAALAGAIALLVLLWWWITG